MKRFLKIAAPSFILGALFGMAFWYLASPLWIDRVVSENVATGDGVMVLARGVLADADAVHKGKGAVTLAKLASGAVEAQLTEFEVTNGPDLEVWLSAHPAPESSADVSGTDWLSLGQLKGNIGNQTYAIPEGIDLSQYKSLVIWCEQFGVLFASAPMGDS